MTSFRQALLISVSVCALGLGTAQAADMYGHGGMKDSYEAMPIPAPIPVEQAARWYLRGDIGYTWYNDPVMTQFGGIDYNDAATVPTSHHVDTDFRLRGANIEEAYSFGGGVGYYFNQHLRGDVTVDYREEADVSGVNTNSYNVGYDHTATVPGHLTVPANSVTQFGFSSTAVLFNLYYDFLPRGGVAYGSSKDGPVYHPGSRFQPYVGAGIGFSVNETTDGITAFDCGSCSGGLRYMTHAGESETNFAAALMAGVAVELRHNFKLDIGYRFMYLGSAQTGAINGLYEADGTEVTDNVTHSDSKFKLDDITAHEIRVGLRYDIY